MINNDMQVEYVGDRLKFIRKSKRMTLKELSEKTNLSIGYLSNLERNTCSPTLINIQKICQSLDVSITELLKVDLDSEMFVRKNARKLVLYEPNQFKYESIHYLDGKIEGLCITLEPHFEGEKKWFHNYDEIGIIIEGSMEIVVENSICDKVYRLDKGDSFYIKSGTQHRLCNSTDIVCESCWFKIS